MDVKVTETKFLTCNEIRVLPTVPFDIKDRYMPKSGLANLHTELW